MENRRLTKTGIRWLAVTAGLAATVYASYVAITWLRFGRVAPSTGDEVDALLDQFAPTYEMGERHQIRVAAPSDLTFVAASEMDIQQVSVVRALFKGRALLLGGEAEEAGRPRTLLAWMQSLGWTVLAHIPGRQIVVGIVMRPWEPDPAPRVVTPAEFAAFREPEYVKIVSTWAAQPIGPDETRFTIATRVATTDPVARRLFRRYWSLFSPGSLIIRSLGVRLIRDEAERRAA